MSFLNPSQQEDLLNEPSWLAELLGVEVGGCETLLANTPVARAQRLTNFL